MPAHACVCTRTSAATLAHARTHLPTAGCAGRILGGPAAALESSTDHWFVKPRFLGFGVALRVRQAVFARARPVVTPLFRLVSVVTALTLRRIRARRPLTPVGLERRLRLQSHMHAHVSCVRSGVHACVRIHVCTHFVRHGIAQSRVHACVRIHGHTSPCGPESCSIDTHTGVSRPAVAIARGGLCKSLHTCMRHNTHA